MEVELVLSFYLVGSGGLNSDHQAAKQVSLHTEPCQRLLVHAGTHSRRSSRVNSSPHTFACG